MSTKKEKCCEVRESPNGCITAFIGQNCPCHQSESIEWEKELKLLLENQGIDTTEEGGNQIFQEQKDLFSQAITTAVAKRELEIAEDAEKKTCPNKGKENCICSQCYMPTTSEKKCWFNCGIGSEGCKNNSMSSKEVTE